MADFELNDGTLAVGGELTVEHAVAFRDALLAALECQGSLTVELSRVTEVDLACLQLLCSALKTAGSLKKDVTISGGPKSLREAMTYLGACSDVGCQHKDAGCFLIQGG